jgi:hypothetical protein
VTFVTANNNDIRFQIDEIQFADGTVWKWSEIVNRKVILGTEGNDTLRTYGKAGEKVTVYGFGGNDTIYGGKADEVFVPGPGNNTIFTRSNAIDEGDGQKIFQWNINDGVDTIYYYNSARVAGDGLGILRFGHGINPENVTVSNSGASVVFSVTPELGRGGSVTFVTANNNDIRFQIDEIQFANGTVWKWATMPRQ